MFYKIKINAKAVSLTMSYGVVTKSVTSHPTCTQSREITVSLDIKKTSCLTLFS